VTWRFLPVYQGEILKYITCHNVGELDITYIGTQGELGEYSGGYTTKCEMIYPDGDVFTCYDVYSVQDGDNLVLKGFVRWLCILDKEDPVRNLYLEWSHDELKLMLDDTMIKNAPLFHRKVPIHGRYSFQPIHFRGSNLLALGGGVYLDDIAHHAVLVA